MAFRYLSLVGGVFTASIGSMMLELMRDEDAAALLGAGKTDLAFIGSDKLGEWTLAGNAASSTIVDTVPINCRMVLAGPASKCSDTPTRLAAGELLTVATSYPYLLGKFATERGLNLVVTAKPKGGCEASASTGRTDLVFDIRNKGMTLHDNGLVVYCEDEQLCLKVLSGIEVRDPTEDTLSSALKRVSQTYIERIRQARDVPAFSSGTIELILDPNKLVKKLFEEFGEAMQALLRRPADKQEIVNEVADLLYPLGIFLALNGLSINDVLAEDIRRNQKE